jgi:hypothetical protein
MTMMAVPGIQRKSGEPTSFSAPPPPAPPAKDEGAKAAASGAGSRLSFSGLKLPNFVGGIAPGGTTMSPSASARSVSSERHQETPATQAAVADLSEPPLAAQADEARKIGGAPDVEPLAAAKKTIGVNVEGVEEASAKEGAVAPSVVEAATSHDENADERGRQ